MAAARRMKKVKNVEARNGSAPRSNPPINLAEDGKPRSVLALDDSVISNILKRIDITHVRQLHCLIAASADSSRCVPVDTTQAYCRRQPRSAYPCKHSDANTHSMSFFLTAGLDDWPIRPGGGRKS